MKKWCGINKEKIGFKYQLSGLLVAFRGRPELRAPIQTSERKDSLAIFSEDEQNREAPQELMVKRAIPVTTEYGDADREIC